MLKHSNREFIDAEQRLVVTIIFLYHGSSYRRLSFNFHLSHYTISRIISETTAAMWKILQPIFLTTPSTEENWLEISENFERRWQLSHSIGNFKLRYIL